MTSDPTEKLDYGTDSSLNPLKEWLGKHIRTIKLHKEFPIGGGSWCAPLSMRFFNTTYKNYSFA